MWKEVVGWNPISSIPLSTAEYDEAPPLSGGAGYGFAFENDDFTSAPGLKVRP
jgi:hypothetical protein